MVRRCVPPEVSIFEHCFYAVGFSLGFVGRFLIGTVFNFFVKNHFLTSVLLASGTFFYFEIKEKETVLTVLRETLERVPKSAAVIYYGIWFFTVLNPYV